MADVPLPEAPVAVVQVDLDSGDGALLSLRPAPGGVPPRPGAYVYALVRVRGRPAATLLVHVPEGEEPGDRLLRAARERVRGREAAAAAAQSARPPRTSVVVATRERSGQLARALDSLLDQDHPDYDIVVVDNAPLSGATEELVRRTYADRVRYVREDTPGLAVAHNRGLAVAGGPVLAFTDDDVVADPGWLTALTAPFAEDPRIGCVTGLILPARLQTPAQLLLESHGGFAKGFRPRDYDPHRPPDDEPLFPFTAGRFGSGANMAFRAQALRDVGGFDPATGTGTPARGGDDLYGFVRVLTAGHRLRYTPDAVVWHHHRETWQDLRNQAYGYGAGLTAYLTALLVRRPALLPALLARLPRGLAHARAMTASRGGGAAGTGGVSGAAGTGGAADASGAAGGVPGEHGGHDHPWPRELSRLERRGMLHGPIGYLKARRRTRGTGFPGR
ncbi:glycosyltransferase [Streptomyces sp. TRM49041]|uniref:glycosyltransferase family 2 protein n=1 Tax=Streptomyces sp. TRM49041 TaxID=2603216 RepID=UPI0011EC9F7A|nr:glycosyltransferase [Streptomyces sp. TRM49041]